jgi:hypothetical protein
MKTLFALLAVVLLSGCAHKNASFYGTKGTPQTVTLLAVAVSDEGDNSELKGNDFLRREIENKIIAEMTAKGFKCMQITDTGEPSHTLIVWSKGVERRTYTKGVSSSPNLVTGGTDVSGGGSYTRKIVSADAILYKMKPAPPHSKIAQSYASGDGRGKGYLSKIAADLSGGVTLSEAYQSVFLEAALSVFE